MKVAVSIPDPLFSAADETAHRLGLSRSQLYAQAIERYLEDAPDDEITARLDDVYATEDSAVERPLVDAQRRAVAETW